MNRYYCRFCGRKIDKWLRSDRIWCSDYCKKADWDMANRKNIGGIKWNQKEQENNQNGLATE